MRHFNNYQTCCIVTEAAWITDEIFVVAQGGVIWWSFFSNFTSKILITLSFMSKWSFKSLFKEEGAFCNSISQL